MLSSLVMGRIMGGLTGLYQKTAQLDFQGLVGMGYLGQGVALPSNHVGEHVGDALFIHYFNTVKQYTHISFNHYSFNLCTGKCVITTLEN